MNGYGYGGFDDTTLSRCVLSTPTIVILRLVCLSSANDRTTITPLVRWLEPTFINLTIKNTTGGGRRARERASVCFVFTPRGGAEAGDNVNKSSRPPTSSPSANRAWEGVHHPRVLLCFISSSFDLDEQSAY